MSMKSAENALFLRSVLAVQDRILKIRVLASLGNFHSRRIILGNFMCVVPTKENILKN